MSVQGLQRAAQVVNVIGQLLPVFGQADEEGIDVAKFVSGTMSRMGMPPDLTAASSNIVIALAAIVQGHTDKGLQP